jgi:hypothetical protein
MSTDLKLEIGVCLSKEVILSTRERILTLKSVFRGNSKTIEDEDANGVLIANPARGVN